MAWLHPPELRAGRVEDFGILLTYAIDGVATPRRIWKLRELVSSAGRTKGFECALSEGWW